MPDGLSLPDQCAYRFLVGLYRDLRNGTITREQAISDKGKMSYQYSLASGTMEQWSKMGKHWADKLKRVEAAQSAYMKNRTLENADALCAVLDGRKLV